MGSVVISVDAELGWGFHDLADPPVERVEHARAGWLTLLDLLDEFDLPATWAYVGHLLLEDCDGRHAGNYPPGWFARERGEWRDTPAFLVGRDLVEAVRDARADHELACHSFSHVEFGRASKELARTEVEASLALAREHGFDLTSFVFPRNRPGHRDVLAEAGFTCYRGPRRGTREKREARWRSRLRRLVRATVVDWTPPLVTPHVDEYGMVNVPASLFLFGFEGRPRRLVEPVVGDPVVRHARRGVDAAAESDGVFHVWLHPNNVVTDRDRARLRAIFEYVDARRGDVAVETMADVARRVGNDSRTPAAAGNDRTVAEGGPSPGTTSSRRRAGGRASGDSGTSR